MNQKSNVAENVVQNEEPENLWDVEEEKDLVPFHKWNSTITKIRLTKSIKSYAPKAITTKFGTQSYIQIEVLDESKESEFEDSEGNIVKVKGAFTMQMFKISSSRLRFALVNIEKEIKGLPAVIKIEREGIGLNTKFKCSISE